MAKAKTDFGPVTDPGKLLKMLQQDITNKDLASAYMRTEALAGIVFPPNKQAFFSPEIAKGLMTAVRRIEKFNPLAAMEAARYLEERAAMTRGMDLYEFRHDMGNKALNIANRVAQPGSTTREAFNQIQAVIRSVRSEAIDTEEKAGRVCANITSRFIAYGPGN